MDSFKKTTTISKKFKMLTADNGSFLDIETGEVVPVAEMIKQAMGTTPFDLSVSTKTEEEI